MADFKPSQGALWQKLDKNGNPYFSGQIEIDGVKYGFKAFSNKKAKDTHPDMKIYLDVPKVESPGGIVEDSEIPF